MTPPPDAFRDGLVERLRAYSTSCRQMFGGHYSATADLLDEAATSLEARRMRPATVPWTKADNVLGIGSGQSDPPAPPAAPRGQDDLTEVFTKLAARMEDLPPDAARILRENLWKLYDAAPAPASPDLYSFIHGIWSQHDGVALCGAPMEGGIMLQETPQAAGRMTCPTCVQRWRSLSASPEEER